MDEPWYDRENGRSSHRRLCVGKLNENGDEIYNSRYASFISGNPSIALSHTVQEGERLLLEKIIQETGVRKTLEECLGEEKAGQMLALAAFSAAQGRRLSEAPPWLEGHGFPAFPRTEVTSLLSSLDWQTLSRFFSLWTKRKSGAKAVLYLLSPRSTYGTAGTYVERGLQEENLSETTLALLAAPNGRPLQVSEFQRRLSDASFPEIFSALREDAEFSVVAGRVFYSEANLRALSLRDTGLIVPMPPSLRSGRLLIKEHLPDLAKPDNLLVDKDNEAIYAVTTQENTRHGRIWRHIYCDQMRKEKEQKAFLERYERIRKGNITKGDERFARKYLDDPEAVSEFMEGLHSCWVLASNREKDPRKALCLYRTRNDMELHFDDLRNSTDSGRAGMDITLHGKILVSFLSLLLVSELKDKVSRTGLKRKYHLNWKDVLEAVSSYSKAVPLSGKAEIHTLPTEAQREIFDAFGVKYAFKGSGLIRDGGKLTSFA